jgi:hypothetical protein
MAQRISAYLRNNVLGLVAIFIALGAGAYAAGLPKNSVKSKQIKAGAVKNSDLADNAVTSQKVANGSLLDEDFAAGQVPQGPEGPQGIQGVPGEAGTARAFAFVNADGTLAATNSKGVDAADVSHPGAPGGRYCFSNLGFTPKSVVATFASGTVAAYVSAVPDATGLTCGAGKAEVVIRNIDGTTLEDGPFMVIFN